MDNKKKNRSPLKNPLLIFLVISVIATVILNMVMLSLQTPKKQEISYSEFLTMLDENKVDEVILQSEQIVIYEKYDESQPITTPKTTEFMKMMGIDTDAVIEQAKENSRNVYYTGYIPDDRLLADLDSHGVKYSTPIQHNSPVLDFFLTWILPLVVIYLLFFILTRSMSKKIGGGGGIMGIGQSNAKMYNVENATGVTFADVADCLALVINSFSTQTSYENQTKKAINNKFIQDAMTEFLRQQLEVYFIENKTDAEKIANQVLVNKKSRENAEKARIDIKKKLTGTMDITNRVEKFVDCRSKDVSQREVYIVEGDSALGSCKLARDPMFQAIMPIRGKILNCLKADYPRIFKSDIITDLVKVLGCGVEIKSTHNKNIESFNLDNLRWDKVIICTDADVDGFQIRTLVLTMIYRLMPTLIEKGKVYIAESPLYEITITKTKRKGEKHFAYTDGEKEEILKKFTEDGLSKERDEYDIKRSKGLGENEPDMMSLTTMHPSTRRLIRVTPENAESTSRMFDVLLGDNITDRKEYIADNGGKYMEMLDLS